MPVRISDRDLILQISAELTKEITRQHEAMETGLPPDRYSIAVGMVRGLRFAMEKAVEVRKANDKEDG